MMASDRGKMRCKITVDILTYDENLATSNITIKEAYEKIYRAAFKLDKANIHGIAMQWQGHPVAVIRVKEPIDIDSLPAKFSYLRIIHLENGAKDEIKVGCQTRGVRTPETNKDDDGPITRWLKIEGTAYGVSTSEMKEWLDQFGTTLTEVIEDDIKFTDEEAESDSEELKMGKGTHSVKMTFFAIPQYLPVFGKKVKIHYRGIVKQCTRCYEQGHLKKDCENQQITWLDYVEGFLNEYNHIPERLFGRWVTLIKEKKSRDEREKHEKEKETQKNDLLNEVAETIKNVTISATRNTPPEDTSQETNSVTNAATSNANAKRGRPKKSKQ
jgi:hypothetical protein